MTGLRASLAGLAAFAALCVGGPANAGGRAPGAIPRGGEFISPASRGSDVLAEAARWLGSGNMTGRPGAWCAWFASFVLERTGRRPLPNGMAASALGYGPRTAYPRPGDLAVMRHHVGFVEGIEPDGSIRLISGNWGHRVARSLAPRWTIVAFVEAP